MSISRRKFLWAAGTAVAATAAFGRAVPAFGQARRQTDTYPIPVEVYSDPMFSLTAAQFQPLVNQTFQFRPSLGKAVSMTLQDVTPSDLLENSNRGYYGESFALGFNAGRARLSEGIYTLSGPSTPAIDVFVAPVGMAGTKYEVVFNHLTR